MYFIYLLIVNLFIFTVNFFFKKKKLISNYNGGNHQKFLNNKNIPLSGGIFFILLIYPIIFKLDQILFLFIFNFFVLGFAADIKFISSTLIRIIFQLIFLVIFVNLTSIQIIETRIIFLDFLLENEIFNYAFVIFCLLVLVNGTNFIDGLNGLVLIYFSLILVLLKINQNDLNLIDILNLIDFILILLISLLIFNLFNQLFLGDGGSYALSIFFGYLLINIHNYNLNISPFFFITLLWYPCFELLFSILRKLISKRHPTNPDTNHLHQLMYFFLLKKLNFKELICNNLSTVLINCYNLIVFILAFNFIFNTKFQVMLVIANIALYILIYFKLFRYKYRK